MPEEKYVHYVITRHQVICGTFGNGVPVMNNLFAFIVVVIVAIVLSWIKPRETRTRLHVIDLKAYEGDSVEALRVLEGARSELQSRNLVQSSMIPDYRAPFRHTSSRDTASPSLLTDVKNNRLG